MRKDLDEADGLQDGGSGGRPGGLGISELARDKFWMAEIAENVEYSL